jgi:hypothetical protein
LHKRSGWVHTGEALASSSISLTNAIGCSDKVGPPPGAAIAATRLSEDPNDEAQYGERVRYVITRAGPGDQLRHRAVPPEVLLFDDTCVQNTVLIGRI